MTQVLRKTGTMAEPVQKAWHKKMLVPADGWCGWHALVASHDLSKFEKIPRHNGAPVNFIVAKNELKVVKEFHAATCARALEPCDPCFFLRSNGFSHNKPMHLQISAGYPLRSVSPSALPQQAQPTSEPVQDASLPKQPGPAPEAEEPKDVPTAQNGGSNDLASSHHLGPPVCILCAKRDTAREAQGRQGHSSLPEICTFSKEKQNWQAPYDSSKGNTSRQATKKATKQRAISRCC